MKYIDYKEQKQHGTFNFPIAYYRENPHTPRYYMQYHWHTEYEIIRIISGTFQLTINNHPITCGKYKCPSPLYRNRFQPINIIFRIHKQEPPDNLRLRHLFKFLIHVSLISCTSVHNSGMLCNQRPLYPYRMRSMLQDGKSSHSAHCACIPGFSGWST